MKKYIFGGVIVLFAVFFGVASLFSVKSVSGSTLAFAVPHMATSSTITVGPQSVTTLAAVNSGCVSRVVSTLAGQIMLSFGGVTPSATVGHMQLASTTVNYNNGDYGCGAITAYGYASTTITVTVFQQ